MFTVVVTEKGGSKQTLEFDEESVTVGRVQGNQIILPRGNVSKQHAKLEMKGGELWISDLGSTNGTYINGRRITEPTPVKPADSVYIGEFILALEVASSGAPAQAPTPSPAPIAPAPPKPRLQGPKAGRPKVPRPPVKTSVRPPTGPQRAPSATVPMSIEDVEAQGAVKLPRPSAPPPPPAARPTTEKGAVVDQLLDVLSRQVKRIDRAALPMKLDEGTAGKARLVLKDLVDEQVSLGRISAAERGPLLGKAFRATVDLGPLGDWLADDEVQEIRMAGPFQVELLKGGAWTEAPRGFTGEEAFAEALRCLGAGVTGRDEGGIPGLVRYRLEDGPLVLATLPPAASGGTFAMIYKNLSARITEVGKPAGLSEEVPRDILAKAVESGSRVAVVGPVMPYRLSVLADICRLAPKGTLLVGVEDLPMAGFGGTGMLGMAAHGLRKGESRSAGVGSLLPRAMDLGADLLAIVGTWWDDLPPVLTCAAGRKGVIADLPLSGGAQMEQELALVFAAGGRMPSSEQAAQALTSAFDIIAVAGRGPEGVPVPVQIIRTGMLGDEWSPKTLYERR